MEFDPLWCVRQGSFEVGSNRSYESLFATGNGYFSVRGCPEEGSEDDVQNVSFRREAVAALVVERDHEFANALSAQGRPGRNSRPARSSADW